MENLSIEQKFMSATDAAKRYKMCYRTLKKIAEQAGAWKKLGKNMVRVDIEKMDKYMGKAS